MPDSPKSASSYIDTEEFRNQSPYSQEAEQSVLGAVLIDSSCLSSVLEYVRAESFFLEQHQNLFSILVAMFSSGQPIDPVTVIERAIAESVFKTEESARLYLKALVEAVPTTANVEAYAKIVQEKYQLRCLMNTARDIIQAVAEGAGEDASSLLDMAEQRIFEIRQGRESTGLQRIDEIIISAYDHLQRLTGEDKEQYLGLSTGFADLDKVLTGLNRTDLILIAARPAMGKSAIGLNIAANVAKRYQKKVAIFNLEMSKEQLVERMLSSEGSITGNLMRTGDLNGDDWVRLATAAQTLSAAPIYIDDAPGISVPEMKARLRRLKDLGLVIIDYLQLMTTGRRIDNRVQEVSEITRSLKIMAKELNVPVITLAQLSRGPENRADHRPVLSDLRESGSIEQDADSVIFLYRDAYYNPETSEQNIAEFIVSKNRHGETGTVKVGWDGRYTRFCGLERFRDAP